MADQINSEDSESDIGIELYKSIREVAEEVATETEDRLIARIDDLERRLTELEKESRG